MLRPTKHSHPDRTVINVSLLLLARLKTRRVDDYDGLRKYAKKSVAIDDKFPRFIYHDGVFESLDDRKKENLLVVIRRYAELGLQPIITLIDSDLPVRADENELVFGRDEIVLSLHDENDQGRLFKIRAW